MKRLLSVTVAGALLGCLMSPTAFAQEGIYSQNFDGFADGETDLGDGSVISSNDGTNSVQSNALRVTQSGINGTASSFVLPPFDGSEGWSATFDFIVEHSGGNTPADGFSFNYGEIPEGDNYGAPAEEGYGEGVPHISFQFDTWLWNDPAQDAGVGIEVAGTEVAFHQAINENANFKPNDSVSASAVMSWDPENGVSFQTSGLTINADFVNVPVEDFTAEPGYGFSILARTGGHNETLIIDNLAVGPLGSFVLEDRDPKIEANNSINIAAEFGTSASGALLVTNAGAAQDLVIESGSLGGAAAGSFEVLTDFPITIPPGESRPIDIRFTAPAAVGSLQATLTLANNDALQIAQNRIITLTGTPFAPAGSYIEDFNGFANGTTDLEDGSVIQSNNESAKIVDGALQITEDGIGGSAASFKLPALGPNANQAFIVTFDLKLEAEGTPADGFSFNYGDISDDATGSEEGFGSGLAVEFDTWDNGGEGANSGIGYDISIDGTDVEDGVLRIEPGEDPRDNRFFKFDGQWRPVEITWFKTGEDSGVFSLSVDGEVFFENLPTPGFTPEPGYRFAFAARTGGAFETLQIDNMSVLTGTEDPNLFVSAKLPSGVVQPDAGVQTLRIPVRNTGTDTTLTLSSVTLNPADSPVYTLVSAPDSLAPGTSDAIEISMDPSKAQGLVTAEVVINSNDPSQPVQRVALSVSVPLSSALLGWYKMDETGAGALVDSSGNNRNGSFSGDVAFGQDPLASGSAVEFGPSGDTGFAAIPQFPETPNLSVSLWTQVTGTSPTGVLTLFSKAHPEDEVAYSLALFPGANDTLAWVVSETPNDLEVFSAEQPLSTPAHVVLVYEDSNGDDDGADHARIYIDGVEVASVESPSGFRDAEDTFQIGARLGDNALRGVVDDVQIYRVALTAEEVTELFENPGQALNVEAPQEPGPPPPPPAGTVVYEQSFDFPDDTTDLGDDSIILSNDGTNSVQGGVLRMTQAEVNGTAAAFILPPFNVSNGWTATFDFVIEHTGENTPADGFSVNYGAIPEGENYGDPAEEGYGGTVPHVSYQFDTWLWDDEAQDAGVGIEVSGSEVAFNKAFGDAANFKPNERVAGQATLSWDPERGASFTTTGLTTNANFSNVDTGAFDGKGTYGFSILARTGGHNETLEIDNLRVVAGATSGNGGGDPGGGGDDDRFAIITDVVVATDGSSVSFTLPEGVTADIEYSTDLINWTLIGSDVTGEFSDTDAARVAPPVGFYRARQDP